MHARKSTKKQKNHRKILHQQKIRGVIQIQIHRALITVKNSQIDIPDALTLAHSCRQFIIFVVQIKNVRPNEHWWQCLCIRV
jgi:hypothetical protein